jgi:hypothetical protein
MEHFRSLLRKVGKGVEEIKDLGALDRYARMEGRASWSVPPGRGGMDEDRGRPSKVGAGSFGAAVLAGHFLPDISALSAATLGVVGRFF